MEIMKERFGDSGCKSLRKKQKSKLEENWGEKKEKGGRYGGGDTYISL